MNAYWGHRNLWGGAEQLRIDGEVSGLGYNDATEPNFKFGVSLKVPGFLDRNTTLDSKAEAVREVLDAYTSTRGLVQSIATYKYSKEIDLLAGLSFETGHVENDDGEWDYTFVGIPLGAKIDTTDSLLDPTEGYRAQLSLTPYPSFLGSSVDMIVAKALGSTYLDLSGGDGDIILAGQLGISSIAGPDIADVPPDKRLYAGGGGSVRGYKYQSIGPLRTRTTTRPGASARSSPAWSCATRSPTRSASCRSSTPAASMRRAFRISAATSSTRPGWAPATTPASGRSAPTSPSR